MALEITGHTYSLGMAGENSSEATFVCDVSEWPAQYQFLLASTDVIAGITENLHCKTVDVSPLGGEGNWTKMRLVAHYVPRLSIEALTVDLPFKWRLEIQGQALTIKGDLRWESDSKPFLKRDALPVKRFTNVRFVLYGIRSVYNLGTYVAYQDHVNSGTFMGAAAETIFFESATAEQRLLMDGRIIYAVEVHMIYRPLGWNTFYRGEEDATYDKLLNPDDSYIYPSVNMSPLLEAPAP